MNINKAIAIPLDRFDGFVYFLNQDGVILDCNEEFLQYINKEKPDVIGRRFEDFDKESGKLIDKVNDIMLGLHSDQDNFIKNSVPYFKTMEFLKLQELKGEKQRQYIFDSQKRLITNQNGQILGLLNISWDVSSDRVQTKGSLPEEIAHELKQLLEVLFGKIFCFFHSIRLDEGEKKEQQKQMLEKITANITKEFDSIFSKLTGLTENRFILAPKVNDRHYAYKMLIVSDRGGFSNFFKAMLRCDCFDIYVCNMYEFEGDIALQSKLYDGVFQFAVFDNFGSKMTNWSWKIHYTTIPIILVKNDDFLQNDLGISEERIKLHFIVDKEDSDAAKDYVKEMFSLWYEFRLNFIRARIKNTGTFKVLLVEDHKDSKDTLSQLIIYLCSKRQVTNLEAISASNGSEALKYLINIEFDLIILDLGLPDMTGYDIVLRLRAIQEKFRRIFTPIIVNTGHDFETFYATEYVQQYGFDRMYLKPHIVNDIEVILDDYVPEKKELVGEA
ncbi:response regulator [Fastidiosibacter lacustris]|uniref:response regulator n=1 Tax=Fastidiosibacter lacustris TaxID=2056695 RepID=UPI000E3410F2|nr:response regulator [Fastidiosibacter lacustris]